MSEQTASTPKPSLDELRQKMRDQRASLNSRRTGSNLRSAKQSLPKKQKNSLLRDVRKKGVKALTKTLGITDPEVERMVADMIRSGSVASAEALIQRIAQYTTEQKAVKMQEQGPPAELLDDTVVMSQLPGANPKRKTLKPLQRTLRPLVTEHSAESVTEPGEKTQPPQ